MHTAPSPAATRPGTSIHHAVWRSFEPIVIYLLFGIIK